MQGAIESSDHGLPINVDSGKPDVSSFDVESKNVEKSENVQMSDQKSKPIGQQGGGGVRVCPTQEN